MASFFSQASSYFGRSNISANYTINESETTHAGLWRIQRAVRTSGGGGVLPSVSGSLTPSGSEGGAESGGTASSSSADKGQASVWSHNVASRGRERNEIFEILKKEASTLTRLRHPCILEVVEPFEEVRSELIFATEPVLAPLSQALLASESAGRASESVQLDEVEIQKGLLQVARGLEFLHGAGLVHCNLTTESILVNAKGDWKVAGFGFLTPLKQPDGTPTPYRYPDYDPSLPPALSRNFDYMAPEYALDEKLEPANDMYSLGCLIYAVHSRGDPPFRNRNSLTNVRQNADQLSTIAGSSSWSRLENEVIGVLSTLVTRYPGSRPNASSFQRSDYFNNILTQTLKFMERDSFAGRTKEERVSFLKGLLKILPQFSDRLLRRKVLPALLELMNDRTLLPFILPNVFTISKNLSSIEFSSNVLPKLKPLFAVQDPPQNQLMLLEQIELFVSKTSPPVFREQVTPLLYSALEAEQVVVQEKALQTVPRLCELLEYSHVKEVLFPKIATVFTKTKVLSVKCNTLICFHSMISVLDKYTLTEKLVPILARIKTREPSVMIATLAVHEAMSKKVDRETLAVHIIPQLWAMSMGAQLTAEQFSRFMRAIDEMGERVKTEHLTHLKELKRMQDHTDSYAGGATTSAQGVQGASSGLTSSGDVDFATLVGSAKGRSTEVSRDMPVGGNALDVLGWDDLGASTSSTPARGSTPALTPSHASTLGGAAPLKPSVMNGTSSSSSLSSAWKPPPTASGLASPPISRPAITARSTIAPPPPGGNRPSLSSTLSATNISSPPSSSGFNGAPSWSGGTLMPSSSSSSAVKPASSASASAGPNYNISLEPATNFGLSNTSSSSSMALSSTSSSGLPPLVPQQSSLGSFPSSAATSTISPTPTSTAATPRPAPPGWGGAVLTPTTKSSSRPGAGNQGGSSAWSDFDPLA